MSDFARKAVHWTQEDVKAAAAVLRSYCWLSDLAIEGIEIGRLSGVWSNEEKRLRDLLDSDFEAMKSLLIFVNEFRCLIEEEQPSQEGSEDVGTDTKEE